MLYSFTAQTREHALIMQTSERYALIAPHVCDCERTMHKQSSSAADWTRKPVDSILYPNRSTPALGNCSRPPPVNDPRVRSIGDTGGRLRCVAQFIVAGQVRLSGQRLMRAARRVDNRRETQPPSWLRTNCCLLCVANRRGSQWTIRLESLERAVEVHYRFRYAR